MNTFIKSIKLLVFAVLVIGLNNSCSNLDEEVYSDLTGEKLFENPDNLISGFGLAYTSLYQLYGNKYMIAQDCGTDLTAVPQRGGDWYDGGEWHRYHRLTWTASEAYVSKAWVTLYGGINTCNQLLYTFQDIDPEVALPAVSELRALRAFYYLRLVDLYGNVPLVTRFDVPEDYLPSTTSRDSVYMFVESELKDALPHLSKEVGTSYYGRVNYYVAQMVLAKLYLNAEVYTGTSQWDLAEAAVDTIIQSGLYELTANSSENFVADASASREILFGIPFDMTEAPGFEIHLFTLHYNLVDKFGIVSASWNGLSAQESLFNLFETGDDRLSGLLYGPQYNADGTQIQDPSFEKFDPKNPKNPKDPDGAGLNLTPQINMLEPNCLRQAGARIAKFPFIAGSKTSTSNDFAIYRYADVLLMKAELRHRLGDDASALTYINQIRERSHTTDLTTVTDQIILDERARELFVEGHRRSDLIRFEVADPTVKYYTGIRWEKPEESPGYVTLWPIPSSQIGVNSNLTQNPGYN